MIIRIMGEGQLKVDDAAIEELNKLDNSVSAAIEQGDETAFAAALHELLARARAVGAPLPPDAIEPSELILPREGATIGEVRELLADGGLIPG
jgi:PspA-Associated protein